MGKRMKIGDVFEIETPKGMGYFQYVYRNSETGFPLTRILPGLYSEEPENMADLVAQKELFLIHFMVNAALYHKLIRKIGNYEIPTGLELPPKYVRRTEWVRGKFNCWHIVDYETLYVKAVVRELDEEQKKLSPSGMWNYNLLVARLAEGWTLEKGSEAKDG